MLPIHSSLQRIIAVILFVSAAAFTKAEAQSITLNGEYSLEKAFKEIERQSGYSFFYNYDLVQKASPVRASINGASLSDALNSLLRNQPFTYSIQNKVIVIASKNNAPGKGPDRTPIPPAQIRGVVLNDDNEVMSGAVVALKGTGKTAVTNDKGEFILTVEPAEAALGTIVITFTGYAREELKINNRKTIQVKLDKSVKQLDNLLITSSYAPPKRKEDVVGSISTVTAKELQTQRPIESFDKMLEGLAAGVQVQTNTELGTPVKINIRGQNSLTSLFNKNQTQSTTSSQPLFIVDGVPVVEQRRGDEPISFINNEELLNPLAGINPADIESISILKDAAATSIYGANASNGVIIITTKKGRKGKTRMSVGYSYGWSQPINQIQWLNGPQYHDLVKELYINDSRDPYTAEVLAGPADISTPWFQLTNRYGRYNNVDFELSGGSDNTQFRLSGGYQKQESMQKANDYQKISFNLRMDHAITPNLKLMATLSPTFINKNAVNVYSQVPIIPNVPAYNADGSFFQLSTLNVPNPLAIIDQNVDNHSGGTLTGNLRLDWQAAKDVMLTTGFGINGLINKENKFLSGENATGASKGGFAEIYDRTNFNWVSFNQANWKHKFKDHSVDVIGGFEAQSQSTKLLRGAGTGFTYYRLNELSYAQSQFSASSKQVSSTYSIYGQASYNYDSRYYLTLSGRFDAASVFGPDFNSTVNAAIGAGWNISKERFLQNVAFIDLFRIRASYGTTGNSRIGSYQAKGIYTFSNTGYNGYTSSSPSSAPNFNLGWEKGYKLNLGLDFNFSKRFNVTFDFYQNIIDDAISSIRIPIVNGFSSTLANVGKMRNRGFDLNFSAEVLNRKFKWTTRLIAGYNKNIILSVKNNSAQYSESEVASILKAGVSTSTIWGFRYAGPDPQTGAPLYVTADGKVVPITLLDRSMTNAYSLGDRLPDLQGGLINTFSYKGFSLSVNFVYSLGGKDLIDYNLEANGNNLTNRNGSVNLLDRWQKPGDIATIPKLALGIPVVNSTQYVYDASFIKLNNISLSYALPTIRGLGTLSASMFFNVTNVAYWYKDEPSSGRNGYRQYRFGSFPESQTFSWGARFSF